MQNSGTFPRLKRIISPIDSFFSDGSSNEFRNLDSTIMAHDASGTLSDDDEEFKDEGFDCDLCGQYVGNDFEYEHHLESMHRHVCTECSRVFPSAFLLSIHLEENHDSFFSVMALKKDSYQCLVEDKSICNRKFKTSEERDEHMKKDHLYKKDFCFENVGFVVNYEED